VHLVSLYSFLCCRNLLLSLAYQVANGGLSIGLEIRDFPADNFCIVIPATNLNLQMIQRISLELLYLLLIVWASLFAYQQRAVNISHPWATLHPLTR
jgi:hypothetical protein